MKHLKRMLLIHWHHYQFEVIAFDKINFMTGKTAAGKSTVIDALQLVLLGETGGSFFNKAANQKSARTLKSYLYGEKGDDGDAGFNYLRESDFTSYVVLEFYDDEKKKAFLTGIVCDCYKDQNFDAKWFVVNQTGLPQDFFIDEKTRTPLDLRRLKARLTQSVGRGGFEFCDTNKRYQQVLLAKFGQLKDRYRTLLKKAVPFSPIADIEQFITESICEVKNPIDIGNMQNNIRQYKNLENDARIMQERIKRLQGIGGIFNDYLTESEKLCQQEYIIIRAEREEYTERENALRRDLEVYWKKAADLRQKADELTARLTKIRADREAVREELIKSDVNQKAKALQAEMEECKGRIAKLRRAYSALLVDTRAYGKSWQEKFAPLAENEALPEAELQAVLTLGAAFGGVSEAALPTLDFSAAAAALKSFADRLAALAGELERQGSELKADIEELKNIVERLERGVKPYDRRLLRLQELIEAALEKKYQRQIKVAIFADLLEIRDPRWCNAIESYLDKQKFYLLLDEAYFADALQIYNEAKKTEGLSEFGLVDIGKLRKAETQVFKNSLAGEIETKHADARLYANYLLGRVVKCENIVDLRRYKTAITAECMLYKNFVARQIDPRRWANPYIGRESLKVQLANKRSQLKEYGVRLHMLEARSQRVKTAKDTRVLERFEAEAAAGVIEDAAQIPAIKESLAAAQRAYDGLDLLYLQRLEERGRSLEAQAGTVEAEWKAALAKRAEAEVDARRTEEKDIPAVLIGGAAVEGRIAEIYDAAWRESVGEPRFLLELKQRPSAAVLKNNFLNSAVGITRNKVEAHRKRLIDERNAYNRDYKMPHDVHSENNDAFAKELAELDAVRLPEYIERIRDARIKSYNQFKDDFLAKIKSNIETVDMQIKELNASIKESVFGTDSYRFIKSPRGDYKRYYDMIMDPLLMDAGGWNIASDSFNEKYKTEISELFQKLMSDEMDVSAERQAEYERDIKKFTDYKTYLTFDLIVTNREGEEQRLSKTLLKKSGGETQIPFYLSLLASFSQVCRIRTKNNNTVRLIILDEAFSKMDGERIQESIRLLRRFDLQAIFSAPPDKISDIAPFVDRNIVVFKEKEHAFTRVFDPKELEDAMAEG